MSKGGNSNAGTIIIATYKLPYGGIYHESLSPFPARIPLTKSSNQAKYITETQVPAYETRLKILSFSSPCQWNH